jgi:hypothetical protein
MKMTKKQVIKLIDRKLSDLQNELHYELSQSEKNNTGIDRICSKLTVLELLKSDIRELI